MADIAERARLEGFSSLEVLIYGGAPVPEVMYDRARNTFSKALMYVSLWTMKTNELIRVLITAGKGMVSPRRMLVSLALVRLSIF